MRVLISVIFISVLASCTQEQTKESVTPVAVSKPTNELMLTDSQVKLANITTQVVKQQDIGQTVPVNARLVANEELTEVISARSAGRIEKLFVKEVGRTVNKGEPLYELYSESLLTLQREYILASEQYNTIKEKRYEDYLTSARKKLVLYGMTDQQVNQLKSISDIRPRITFLATASGIVKEVKVAEGQYLNEGDALYQLENTKSLWVEAELYPSELNYVKVGDLVTVNVAGYESLTTEAKVIFLSPEYQSNTQITIMRALVSNSSLQWKPGMQSQVFLKHSEKTSLAVPVDAVIHDQYGTHVFIQSAANTFIARMVKTGLENFNSVEITDGLKEGETIVVSGAYLLYSEMVLKKGIDSMVSHQHESK